MTATPDPARVVAALGDRPGAVWLDGGDAPGGWSIVAWDPEEVVTDGRDWPASGRALRRAPPRACPDPVPFAGGVIGYVGFGAGHRVAPVPAEAPTPEPEVWLGRFPGALCLDHRTGRWHAAGPPGFVADARVVLAAAAAAGPPTPDPAPPTGTARSVARDAYEVAVQRILALLHEGDCYQVNLTRPVWVRDVGPPLPAYLRLRRAAAPYGAYLQLGRDLAVLSNSPELLLEVRGDRVRSAPIKGTRPRGASPAEDDALRAALRDSAKDRAELTMIVDLVRNDLGRIAGIGSVEAEERQIVAHPTVFHAVQPVVATLRPGIDAWDALAACFPPGSVTGAPKVRACERIAELEPHPRGVYCGAIGYVDDRGDAVWNVAIRTAVVAGADARYHVGGGIVIGSDPADEWAETVAKEAALRRALVRPPVTR